MEPRSSMRKKRGIIITLIVFVLMMIIPAALVGVYYNTNNSLTSQEIVKQQTLSDLAALALKIKLDSLVSIASMMADSPQLVSYAAQGQWSNAVDVARDLQNSDAYYDPFIDRVSIFDVSGTQDAAYPTLVGGVGTNATNSAWYAALSQGNQSFYVTNVTRRTSLPQIQVVNIAVPIKSSATIVGFLILQIPTDNFLEFGENLALGTYGFAYVVDSQGNIVAHPKFFSDDSGVVNYASVPEVQQVINGNSGTDVVIDGNSGDKSLVTYKPVETYGWGIITQELYSEAFSTRSAILFQLELLIGVTTLINILIAYAIFRTITAKKKNE
jgi:hypothetical protein